MPHGLSFSAPLLAICEIHLFLSRFCQWCIYLVILVGLLYINTEYILSGWQVFCVLCVLLFEVCSQCKQNSWGELWHLYPHPNVLVALSKGIWAVYLCCNKTLQCLLGGCLLMQIVLYSSRQTLVIAVCLLHSTTIGVRSIAGWSLLYWRCTKAIGRVTQRRFPHSILHLRQSWCVRPTSSLVISQPWQQRSRRKASQTRSCSVSGLPVTVCLSVSACLPACLFISLTSLAFLLNDTSMK